MDEPLRVIREHDPVERVFVGGQVGKAVIGRSRDRDRPLLAATLQADDDVFLQHLVIPESLVARLEQVHVADRRPLKDEVTERAVIRPVAEAARDDGHDLPARRCLAHGQRDKGGIQIHRLDADSAQGQPVV